MTMKDPMGTALGVQEILSGVLRYIPVPDIVLLKTVGTNWRSAIQDDPIIRQELVFTVKSDCKGDAFVVKKASFLDEMTITIAGAESEKDTKVLSMKDHPFDALFSSCIIVKETCVNYMIFTQDHGRREPTNNKFTVPGEMLEVGECVKGSHVWRSYMNGKSDIAPNTVLDMFISMPAVASERLFFKPKSGFVGRKYKVGSESCVDKLSLVPCPNNLPGQDEPLIGMGGHPIDAFFTGRVIVEETNVDYHLFKEDHGRYERVISNKITNPGDILEPRGCVTRSSVWRSCLNSSATVAANTILDMLITMPTTTSVTVHVRGAKRPKRVDVRREEGVKVRDILDEVKVKCKGFVWKVDSVWVGDALILNHKYRAELEV
ncbi:hypothetical protein PRZ48_010250 [Zasmidium cellare]|uniref:Uncharacterized protein n=1 Tax=Zasmidium cellare TaxID=395010 RepID=A0ABR0E836_ZASCE|nr:hypothetical protein PRZ48_010250 [Zasmidium cellare]